jgi:hypothetical protein
MGWVIYGVALILGADVALLWLVMTSRSVASTTDEG